MTNSVPHISQIQLRNFQCVINSVSTYCSEWRMAIQHSFLVILYETDVHMYTTQVPYFVKFCVKIFQVTLFQTYKYLECFQPYKNELAMCSVQLYIWEWDVPPKIKLFYDFPKCDIIMETFVCMHMCVFIWLIAL